MIPRTFLIEILVTDLTLVQLSHKTVTKIVAFGGQLTGILRSHVLLLLKDYSEINTSSFTVHITIISRYNVKHYVL